MLCLPRLQWPDDCAASRSKRIVRWGLSRASGWDDAAERWNAPSPSLAADLCHTLRDARYLVAIGRLERVRWYRSVWAFQLGGVQVGALRKSS